MSKQSAVVIVLVALEANSIHNVTLKGHVIPLAKKLQSWSKVVGTFFCNYHLTDISSRKQQKRDITAKEI